MEKKKQFDQKMPGEAKGSQHFQDVLGTGATSRGVFVHVAFHALGQ